VCKGEIGTQLDRLGERRRCSLIVAISQADKGLRQKRPWLACIAGESPTDAVGGCGKGRVGILPSLEDPPSQANRFERVGSGVAGIQLNGVIQHVNRFPGRAVGMLAEEMEPADEALPGVEALRRFALCPIDLRLLQLWCNGAEHAARNLILQIEDVLDRTIEAIRPQMRAGCCVDELAGDTHPVAGSAHTAF
jgi:hypothetical protein